MAGTFPALCALCVTGQCGHPGCQAGNGLPPDVPAVTAVAGTLACRSCADRLIVLVQAALRERGRRYG